MAPAANCQGEACDTDVVRHLEYPDPVLAAKGHPKPPSLSPSFPTTFRTSSARFPGRSDQRSAGCRAGHLRFLFATASRKPASPSWPFHRRPHQWMSASSSCRPSKPASVRWSDICVCQLDLAHFDALIWPPRFVVSSRVKPGNQRNRRLYRSCLLFPVLALDGRSP
jgi:hypothetical protein